MTNIRLKFQESEIQADNLSEQQANKLLDAFVYRMNHDLALLSPYPMDEVVAFYHPVDHVTVADEDDECFGCEEDSCEGCTYADNTEHDEHEDEDIESSTDDYDPFDNMAHETPEPEVETVYADTQRFGTNIGDKLREAAQKKLSAVMKPKELHEPVEKPEPSNAKEGYIKQQDHHQTGMKYRELKGVMTEVYRCRYTCPNPMCKEKGNHYIPKDSTYVYCHTCNTKIKVEDATSMGFPNRDDWGNFYLATKEF